MSTATATFRSQRGPYYKIQIISDNITTDEDLTLAGQQPLMISFRAGEHKFPGFRSVECQITLLADKDMSYLYSNTPTGTRVEVKGSADGESNWYWVFFGYLEPFTYDQPYSLCNDEVVLTAIDAISILKFSPYEGAGLYKRQIARKFITDICDEAGIDQVDISPDSETLEETISTNAFLPNNFTDKTQFNKMQVISAICQMRGLTATPWGKRLYIIDTTNELSGSSWSTGKRYSINHTTHVVTANTVLISGGKTVSNADFNDNKVKMTIERPYGKIKYSLPNSGPGYIIPPLLEKGTPAGNSIMYVLTDSSGAKYVTSRRLLTGTGINWHAYSRTTGTELTESDFLNNWNLLNPDNNNDWVGAVPVEISYYRRDSEYTGITTRRCLWVHQRPCSEYFGTKTLFSIKDKYRGILLTGNFRVRMSAARGQVSRNGDNYFPPVLGNQEGAAGTMSFYFMNLICGSYYYTDYEGGISGLPSGQWLLGGYVPFKLGRPGSYGIKDILTTYEAMYAESGWSGWVDNVPAPSGGWPNEPWNLNYVVNASSTLSSDDFWIFDFSIENEGYDAKESDLEQDLNNGVYQGDVLDIQLPLHNIGYGKDNAIYPQGGFSGVAGKLGQRLATRYATQHKGFEMTLGADVEAWGPVTFNGARYTIDSMIWDLEAGKKTIYIN